ATIGQLVTQVLDELNKDVGYQPPLAPEFQDIRTLHQNRHLLRRLRRDGCVAILDSISLRHPVLQRAFQQSVLDAYPTTSIVTIAPVEPAVAAARKLTVVLKLQFAELEFSKRRLDYEDGRACEELSDAQRFEEWLLYRVPKLGLHATGGE